MGPQERNPPQPSEYEPQVAPSDSHVAFVQHWRGKHDCPESQVPHCSVPPHPFEYSPQVAPHCEQVIVVQPHEFGSPPPPQV
jgi:hypothetical protein